MVNDIREYPLNDVIADQRYAISTVLSLPALSLLTSHTWLMTHVFIAADIIQSALVIRTTFVPLCFSNVNLY